MVYHFWMVLINVETLFQVNSEQQSKAISSISHRVTKN
jgi:hypothetical protein